MIKVCTNCANGSYDYGVEKLFCNGKVKNTNTACENWTQREPTCYITHQGWARFKKGHHGY